MLKNLGHIDLALVAANRSMAAAEELGDPLWRAYAGFRRSHALIPAGSPARAVEVPAAGSSSWSRKWVRTRPGCGCTGWRS